MIPAIQLQIVGIRRLAGDADFCPCITDLDFEAGVAMTVDAQKVSIVVALLHQWSPTPGISTHGRPGFQGQSCADGRRFGGRQIDQTEITIKL